MTLNARIIISEFRYCSQVLCIIIPHWRPVGKLERKKKPILQNIRYYIVCLNIIIHVQYTCIIIIIIVMRSTTIMATNRRRFE